MTKLTVRQRIVGVTLGSRDLHDAVDRLENRWKTSFHVLGNQSGWYRNPTDADRIGVVATSNGMESLALLKSDFGCTMDAIETLLEHRKDEKFWSFISNLNDRPVIDATCAVLDCFRLWQHHSREVSDLVFPAIDASLDWLEGSSLADGGWGIVTDGPFRTYSTALAVRTLSLYGRDESIVVRRAVQKLIASRDSSVGGWRDASGQMSISVTAECLRALQAASEANGLYLAEKRFARDWLIALAKVTDLWSTGAHCGHFEEVFVDTGSGVRRVDFVHSSRAMATLALVEGGQYRHPAVVRSVRSIVQDINSDDWTAYAQARYSRSPPSWMVFDVSRVVTEFRNRAGSDMGSIWADGKRSVVHSSDSAWFAKRMREHWRKVAMFSLVATLFVVLQITGVVPEVGLQALLLIVWTIILNVASSVLWSLFERERNN